MTRTLDVEEWIKENGPLVPPGYEELTAVEAIEKRALELKEYTDEEDRHSTEYYSPVIKQWCESNTITICREMQAAVSERIDLLKVTAIQCVDMNELKAVTARLNSMVSSPKQKLILAMREKLQISGTSTVEAAFNELAAIGLAENAAIDALGEPKPWKDLILSGVEKRTAIFYAGGEVRHSSGALHGRLLADIAEIKALCVPEQKFNTMKVFLHEYCPPVECPSAIERALKATGHSRLSASTRAERERTEVRLGATQYARLLYSRKRGYG